MKITVRIPTPPKGYKFKDKKKYTRKAKHRNDNISRIERDVKRGTE